MKLINQNPNFSIVVPGNCNAKCSFCFWKHEKECSNYIYKLEKVLNNLPKEFKQISLTGGEPTLSPYILSILKLIDKKRFPKLVLTTNGTKLSNLISSNEDLFSKIDHLNISRHAIDDEDNRDVFNTSSIISSSELKEAIAAANHFGIDTTLNCVLQENNPLSIDNCYKFIEYAKDLGAIAIAFRKEHGNLEPTEQENHFVKYHGIINESACPVCRTTYQKLLDMNIYWKANSIEPSIDLDGVYELIFQTNGKLTMDWEGKIEMKKNKKNALKSIGDSLIEIGKQLKKLAEEDDTVVSDQKSKKVRKIETSNMNCHYSGCGFVSGCGNINHC